MTSALEPWVDQPPGLEAMLAGLGAGTLHGIEGWSSASLPPSVTMTSSPLAADRIGHRDVFLPVDAPVEVTTQDAVHVAIQLCPEDVVTGSPS